MMWPRFDMRRMMIGYGSVAATASVLGFVALQNDSLGPHLLLLRDIQIPQPSNGQINLFLADAAPGTLARRGFSAYTGVAPGPGQIYTGTASAALAAWTQIGFTGNTSLYGTVFNHDWPILALRPGKVLVLADNAVNQNVNVMLFWQWVTPEEFTPEFAIEAAIEKAGF
jgi:hypothetical protein